MNKKHVVRAAGIYASIVAGIFLILVGFNWFMLKQELVQLGFARPNFPYTKYNQEELNKLFPQYYTVDVPTKQTPEETYVIFIHALKDGNLEFASQQFFARNIERYPVNYELDKSIQKKWLDSLNSVKEKGLMEKMINDFDTEIKKVSMTDVVAQYEIGIKKDGQMLSHSIEFMKDIDGTWKLNSL